jgi:CDP-diacylglycerol--glycerol-3-phosphate 3-phosphatidyltransferase
MHTPRFCSSPVTHAPGPNPILASERCLRPLRPADPVSSRVFLSLTAPARSGTFGAVVALPAAVIVCREVGVSAIREWMGSRGMAAVVAVGHWGKIKTAMQMVSLQLLLLVQQQPAGSTFDERGQLVGLALLYSAAVIACTSAVGYVRAAWPTFSD